MAEEERSFTNTWGLSLGAILVMQNGGDPHLFGGFEKSSKSQESSKQLLNQGWGVSSKDDLFKSLKWLKEEGNRKEFETIQRNYSKLDNDRVQSKLRNITNPKEVSRIEFVLNHDDPLNANGILAWDMGRFVTVTGWGYLAGYISEKEAEEKISTILPMTQRSFQSWEEYAISYRAGRKFWNEKKAVQEEVRLDEIISKLLNDPQGMWNQNPWPQ